MLSLPDFMAKQILFLESQDAKELSFQNDNLILKNEGKKTDQIPCIKVFAIFIVGEFTLTMVLIRKLLSYGITIFLLKKNYQTYAVLGNETEGNVLLRRKQYEGKNSFEIAKKIVDAKLQNQADIFRKTRLEALKGTNTQEQIGKIRSNILMAKDIASLMGIEGSAAKMFFSSYFSSMNWHGRKPRTKYDIPNVLLDIGYTFLFHFIDAQLRLYGFDTYVGNLHQEFYQRKSLVCDMVEPCRCIVDKALLKAFNLKQINEKDFSIHQGQYILKYKTASKYSRIFLEAIMSEKEGIFKYIQSFYRAVMKDSLEFETFHL
ncbi:type V CRISPR-associated endonuclease Cas1 [Candidatus Gracilibacteria bacterium]|nr:type V CRISPR-associated endonuclease Cas1 [Candidatus Gracilibacteria bacterium]